jgi:hypothetical protein
VKNSCAHLGGYKIAWAAGVLLGVLEPLLQGSVFLTL